MNGLREAIPRTPGLEEQLLAALAQVAELEARITELTRPKLPADYGLGGIRFTVNEGRVLMALLPPGEQFHRTAIIRAAWPDVAEAGLVGVSGHLLGVHLSRVRLSLRPSGWRVASAGSHGLYVLLAPGDAVPFGFRAYDGATKPETTCDRSRPCPGCDGRMAHNSKRCARCYAARPARPKDRRCPACGGPKSDHKGGVCRGCHLLRRRGLLKGWAAA